MKKKFTSEEREQAFNMLRMGITVPAISKELGMSIQTLYKWKSLLKKSPTPQPIKAMPKYPGIIEIVILIGLGIVIYKIW